MGRMDGQTHRINGMHALIKFPEYIPYGLGDESGMYGPTDGHPNICILMCLSYTKK